MIASRSERLSSPQSYQASTQVTDKGLPQPPPQALRFSYTGECETRVTDDEAQGIVGRSSSRLPLRAMGTRQTDSLRPSLMPEENNFRAYDWSLASTQ